MKRLSVISISIFLLFISCEKTEYLFEDDEVCFKWSVKKYRSESKTGSFRIDVFCKYNIKNKSDKDIWFYDQENGSLWQEIKTYVNNGIIENHYIMYGGEWVYLLPYDYAHPKSIRIKQNKIIRGTTKIEYFLDYNYNLTNISKQNFNFFILDQDISTDQNDENTVKNIAENHAKSYIVELPWRNIRKRVM